MNQQIVYDYAKGIALEEFNLANSLFNSEHIMNHFKWEIWKKLEEIGVVHPPDNKDHWKLTDIEFDSYDMSIELMDCEDGFTLTSEQHKAIKDMGFSIIFVNYKKGPHLYGNHTAAMDAMPVIKD